MQPSSKVAFGASDKKRALISAALTTIAQVSKIGVGFAFIKLIAVYLGAGGMGQLGHFMSAVTFLSLLAGGGVVNGLIKYVAQYKKQPKQLMNTVAVSKAYSLMFCILICLFGCVFSRFLSEYIFKTPDYYWIIVFLSVAQFGFAFTNLVTGVTNGLRDTKTYAIIQIVGNVLVLPVSWILIKNFHLVGAALSMVFFFSLYTIPALYFYRRSIFFKLPIGFKYESKGFKRLLAFTLMAMVGAVSVPLIEIIIREQIIEHVGFVAAGIWQASIKLSSAYMGFFTIFLAVYFMPMVSEKAEVSQITPLVLKFMKLVMAIFVLGAAVFYMLRQYLIPLLLSAEFVDLEGLIKYQLLADFFRVTTYVISFVVVAKAALRIYLVSELTQGLIFCGLSLFSLHSGLGVEGVFFANLIMNIVYFVVSIVGFMIYRWRSV
ncbi:PST family polysaccharide transporter/antigen flippase [Pseudomonas sp. 3296]|uniref:O-antigen translocase n=1 Tax=Pseudomonas sp. 3296 TaxID=2817753 RepID=UPI002863966A|nr:O-antigen translocase [Pseudomonas sp. 3296]MDR6917750.1 PST family polysaccharide transporter/antigen flippase [Pseudomonas sp. 3296]